MAVCGTDDPKLFSRALASVFDNDLKPDHVVLVVDGPLNGALDQKVRSLSVTTQSRQYDSPETGVWRRR